MQQRAGLRERVSTPKGGSPDRGVIYLHGGAYVVGSHRSHAALCDWICDRAAATVWLPNYRLAPEHPCPAAIEDVVGSYRDLLATGWKAAQLAIAGDSAGGGLCLAAALAIRDAGLPLPGCLAVLSPLADLALSSESIQRERDNDILLTQDWLEFGAAAYAGSLERANPACSPINGNLNGLPPVLIQAGTCELLADDATRLHQRLRDSGVDSTLQVSEGAGHVFQLFAGLDPVADDAVQALGSYFRERLAGS